MKNDLNIQLFQHQGVTIFRVEPEASLLDPKSAFRRVAQGSAVLMFFQVDMGEMSKAILEVEPLF